MRRIRYHLIGVALILACLAGVPDVLAFKESTPVEHAVTSEKLEAQENKGLQLQGEVEPPTPMEIKPPPTMGTVVVEAPEPIRADKDFAIPNDALEELKDGERERPGRQQQPPAPIHGYDYTVAPDEKAALGKALYNDYIKTLDHNVEIFRWQLFSTKIIFIVVLLLILTGLAFSGYQIFYKKDLQNDPVTELEWGSLKIKSPVIGLIILMFSLFFFYLYLTEVYPIKYMEPSTSQAETSEETSKP